MPRPSRAPHTWVGPRHARKQSLLRVPPVPRQGAPWTRPSPRPLPASATAAPRRCILSSTIPCHKRTNHNSCNSFATADCRIGLVKHFYFGELLRSVFLIPFDRSIFSRRPRWISTSMVLISVVVSATLRPNRSHFPSLSSMI